MKRTLRNGLLVLLVVSSVLTLSGATNLRIATAQVITPQTHYTDPNCLDNSFNVYLSGTDPLRLRGSAKLKGTWYSPIDGGVTFTYNTEALVCALSSWPYDKNNIYLSHYVVQRLEDMPSTSTVNWMVTAAYRHPNHPNYWSGSNHAGYAKAVDFIIQPMSNKNHGCTVLDNAGWRYADYKSDHYHAEDAPRTSTVSPCW